MRREIVIHSLGHAQAALAAAVSCGKAVTLASAADAALQAGPSWFKAVIDEARAAYPQIAVTAILDCGDEPGAVMAALRLGLTQLRFHGAAAFAAKLQGMGAHFVPPADSVLDLHEIAGPEAACAAFLRES